MIHQKKNRGHRTSKVVVRSKDVQKKIPLIVSWSRLGMNCFIRAEGVGGGVVVCSVP